LQGAAAQKPGGNLPEDRVRQIEKLFDSGSVAPLTAADQKREIRDFRPGQRSASANGSQFGHNSLECSRKRVSFQGI
jgi:hypothetical protein